MTQAEPGDCPTRIGVILVHGIGEQRRFQHLDWQGRDIIVALRKQSGFDATVEIGSSPVAAFHAEQDTWASGPHAPVRASMRCKATGKITHLIDFHEVWWADINERYSLMKQLRFWFWGLAVWAYPKQGPETNRLHGTDAVSSPALPDRHDLRNEWWQRTRLFMVGWFFLVAGFSAGPGLLLLRRVFGLNMPDVLKTLTNYVSGVKLFNQRHRYGPGFGWHPPHEDLLDTLDEPPRVSIRRRMIRTIAAVAKADYHRWYIVAHSQGTIAALNGLMETPYAWPGYFNEDDWNALGRLHGSGRPACQTDPTGPTMPRRPAWAEPTDVAYRARIFEKFRGLLTLGSPIEKFAAIWPARVPICRIPAFRENTVWINVLDPLDPVSGRMLAYRTMPDARLVPQDMGYKASWKLLVAHLRYLTWSQPGCLADGVAQWLLTGNERPVLQAAGQFPPGQTVWWYRTVVAWAWWLAAFALLGIAGGAVVLGLWNWLPPALRLWCADTNQLAWSLRHVGCLAGLVVLTGFVGTLVAGGISRWHLFHGHDDPPAPKVNTSPKADPDPDPPRYPAWPRE